MKWVYWLYLVVYSLFIVFTVAMSLLTKTGSLLLYIQAAALLIPSFVLSSELYKKPRHFAFSLLGLIVIIPVVADTHKFVGFSVVAPAMYALFLPMAGYLTFNVYRRFGANT